MILKFWVQPSPGQWFYTFCNGLINPVNGTHSTIEHCTLERVQLLQNIAYRISLAPQSITGETLRGNASGQCEKIFQDASVLVMHKRTSTDERPFNVTNVLRHGDHNQI